MQCWQPPPRNAVYGRAMVGVALLVNMRGQVTGIQEADRRALDRMSADPIFLAASATMAQPACRDLSDLGLSPSDMARLPRVLLVFSRNGIVP